MSEKIYNEKGELVAEINPEQTYTSSTLRYDFFSDECKYTGVSELYKIFFKTPNPKL